MQKSESAESIKDAVIPPPTKVDFATNLFDMLSMDGPTENGSGSGVDSAVDSAEDSAWAGFQCTYLSLIVSSCNNSHD